MSALSSANPRNFSVKRIMKEYAEFQKLGAQGENDYFQAAPCEDNLFEWHFTIRGPPDSDFAGGRYHGRILLPSQYPFKPPDIVMLTPSGRFETNKKICLSISSFHPKNWSASWSIRTVLTALIAFFPTPGAGAIGSLDYSPSERRAYASRSAQWKCDLCGQTNEQLLPDLPAGVKERAAPPKLDADVAATLEANRDATAAANAAAAAAAAAGGSVGAASTSQPSTPALAATAAPATPLQLAAAQRLLADQPPSGPGSPAFLSRAASAQAAVAPAVPTPATAPAANATAATNAPPLVLDEGLRQRQGRVVLPGAAPATGPAPAAAAVPAQAQQQQQGGGGGSSFTLFLVLLIVLILARKLYASSQAKAAFSFDFSQD